MVAEELFFLKLGQCACVCVELCLYMCVCVYMCKQANDPTANNHNLFPDGESNAVLSVPSRLGV